MQWVDANDAVRMSWVKHWPNDTKKEFNVPTDGHHKYDLLQECSPIGECFAGGGGKSIFKTQAFLFCKWSSLRIF